MAETLPAEWDAIPEGESIDYSRVVRKSQAMTWLIRFDVRRHEGS